MNSIIEAQLTLQEEQAKEKERCRDPEYFFKHYWKTENRLPFHDVIRNHVSFKLGPILIPKP